MGGLAFFRRLPRWARRLWSVILLVTAIELALLGAALIWAPGWIWLATELFSLSAWPLGAGVLVVVIVGGFTRRRREPSAVPEPPPPAPQAPTERQPKSQRSEGGIEVAAGRGAARLLAQAARRPEGQAAIRRTGRLARAVRAATRPPEKDGDQPRP